MKSVKSVNDDIYNDLSPHVPELLYDSVCVDLPIVTFAWVHARLENIMLELSDEIYAKRS